jgi:16S rRNA G966 N2-methylase RsmD
MTNQIVSTLNSAISKNVEFTPTGLKFNADISFDDWLLLGNYLKHIEGAVHWWIGDHLNYGQQEYGKMYEQMLDSTEFSYGTLRKDKYVAGRIELFRRRNNSSWSHHAEVARMELDDQDYWLDIAEQEGLSQREFRRWIKRGRPAIEPGPMPDGGVSTMKLYAGDFAEVAKTFSDSSVDVIITDPPYSKEFLPLYELLAIQAKRLLKPGGSLLAMTGQFYLPWVMDLMRTISYHTPGGQSPQIWPRKVNAFWKPVLWFVNGEYTGRWIGDVIKSKVNDNDKRYHEWGQSESGIFELVEKHSKPGDLVLDPFCGGGTVGVAAIALSRRFTGIDIDPSNIEITRKRLAHVV